MKKIFKSLIFCLSISVVFAIVCSSTIINKDQIAHENDNSCELFVNVVNQNCDPFSIPSEAYEQPTQTHNSKESTYVFNSEQIDNNYYSQSDFINNDISNNNISNNDISNNPAKYDDIKDTEQAATFLDDPQCFKITLEDGTDAIKGTDYLISKRDDSDFYEYKIINDQKNISIKNYEGKLEVTNAFISIPKDKTINITLKGVNINNEDLLNGSPIVVEDSTKNNVTITLAENTVNTLKSEHFPALKATCNEWDSTVPEEGYLDYGSLIINGKGKLNAIGGILQYENDNYISSAIGGGWKPGEYFYYAEKVVNIDIEDATIYASQKAPDLDVNSGDTFGAAAIGASSGGTIANFKINNSNVSAISVYGPGIGTLGLVGWYGGLTLSGASTITVHGKNVPYGKENFDYDIGNGWDTTSIYINGGSIKTLGNGIAGKVLDNPDGKNVYLAKISNQDQKDIFINEVQCIPSDHTALDKDDTTLYTYQAVPENNILVVNVGNVGEDTIYFILDKSGTTPIWKQTDAVVEDETSLKNALEKDSNDFQIILLNNIECKNSSNAIWLSSKEGKTLLDLNGYKLEICNNSFNIPSKRTLDIKNGSIVGHTVSSENFVFNLDVSEDNAAPLEALNNTNNNNLGDAITKDSTIFNNFGHLVLNGVNMGSEEKPNNMIFSAIYNDNENETNTVTISECNFSHNISTYNGNVKHWGGSCIFNIRGTANIEETNFENCKTNENQSGGAINNSATMVLRDCSIKFCSSGYGSAIFNNKLKVGEEIKTPKLTLTETTIQNNTAYCYGAIASSSMQTITLNSQISISDNFDINKKASNFYLYLNVSNPSDLLHFGENFITAHKVYFNFDESIMTGKDKILISDYSINEYTSIVFFCDNKNYEIKLVKNAETNKYALQIEKKA